MRTKASPTRALYAQICYICISKYLKKGHNPVRKGQIKKSSLYIQLKRMQRHFTIEKGMRCHFTIGKGMRCHFTIGKGMRHV